MFWGWACGWVGIWVQNLFSVDMRFDLSWILSFLIMGFCVGGLGGWRERPVGLRIRLPFLLLMAGFHAAWAFEILRPYRAAVALEKQPDFFEVLDPQRKQALEILEQEARNTSDPGIFEKLAFLYAKEKKWDPAIFYYRKTIEKDPSRPGPYNNLANIFYTLGKAEDAIGFWKASLKVQPRQLDAHLNLGLSYYHQGRLKEASRHLQEVLKIDPRNEKAIVLMKKMVE